MAGSSDQSVYEGKTPSKHLNAIAATIGSPPQAQTSRDNVRSYLSTKNSGGDPVTALALRPESTPQSAAERLAAVERNIAASLTQLNPK
ncbi:hypothetical protein PG990_004088 [Apiospora arundinis]